MSNNDPMYVLMKTTVLMNKFFHDLDSETQDLIYASSLLDTKEEQEKTIAIVNEKMTDDLKQGLIELGVEPKITEKNLNTLRVACITAELVNSDNPELNKAAEAVAVSLNGGIPDISGPDEYEPFVQFHDLAHQGPPKVFEGDENFLGGNLEFLRNDNTPRINAQGHFDSLSMAEALGVKPFKDMDPESIKEIEATLSDIENKRGFHLPSVDGDATDKSRTHLMDVDKINWSDGTVGILSTGETFKPKKRNRKDDPSFGDDGPGR